MGLKKLLEILRESKDSRKNWYIKWKIKGEFDTDGYLFMFLPTVIWSPWPYRRHGENILTIAWLNFHIDIGEWVRRGI